MDHIILGAAFMKNYYMIFDVDGDRFGISNLYSTANIYAAGPPINNTVIKKPGGGGSTNGGKGDGTDHGGQFNNIAVYVILIAIILLLTLFIIILVFAIWFFGFRQAPPISFLKQPNLSYSHESPSPNESTSSSCATSYTLIGTQ
jgi:hypothetical protein